jgi:hypothetical protein
MVRLRITGPIIVITTGHIIGAIIALIISRSIIGPIIAVIISRITAIATMDITARIIGAAIAIMDGGIIGGIGRSEERGRALNYRPVSLLTLRQTVRPTAQSLCRPIALHP